LPETSDFEDPLRSEFIRQESCCVVSSSRSLKIFPGDIEKRFEQHGHTRAKSRKMRRARIEASGKSLTHENEAVKWADSPLISPHEASRGSIEDHSDVDVAGPETCLLERFNGNLGTPFTVPQSFEGG
jgi:hypothetical protein